MLKLISTILFVHAIWMVLAIPVHADEFNVPVSNEVEVPVKVYPASGENLLLMLPSEHGYLTGHHQLASAISQYGTEVWMADLFAAYFLPVSSSGMNGFLARDISSLVDKVHQQTGKRVFLVTNDKGTEPLLEAIRHWQKHSSLRQALAGAVVISPYLYSSTPAAGQEVNYVPIATSTNFNLFLMQPKLSPKYWQFREMVEKLEQGGSDVYTQKLDDVRDRFFFRPDATDEEQALAGKLPLLLHRAVRLTGNAAGERDVVDHPQDLDSSDQLPGTSAAKRGLQLYQGGLAPRPFILDSLEGASYALKDFRGQVVLLNFWATWCPPCVHEMPSMQALENQFAEDDFRIVAINMAEEPDVIRKFLQKMKVDFMILLDSDGQVLRDWKVFAFPTSYLLDREGQIRYAGFGAIEWTEEEVLKQIRSLVD